MARSRETSSRHSEVIRRYLLLEGSNKALLRGGKNKLYDLSTRGVAHHRIGKLIVATTRIKCALENIRLRARANGVEDLEFLSGNEVTALGGIALCHGLDFPVDRYSGQPRLHACSAG